MSDAFIYVGSAVMIGSIFLSFDRKIWRLPLDWAVWLAGAALAVAGVWVDVVGVKYKLMATAAIVLCVVAAYFSSLLKERKVHAEPEVHEGQDDGSAPEEAEDGA